MSDVQLTKRELEAGWYLCHGLTNREIGKRMACTQNNVKFHVANINSKLGVFSRTEAAVKLLKLGLIKLEHVMNSGITQPPVIGMARKPEVIP